VKKLEEKHGYTPAEAIEIQTLIGDSTDNVPGIPGVGDKTAVKLVKKYGSADAVLQHLDELTPKMRENFDKYRDRLPIARSLVTLKDDVEIEFDPQACKFTGLNIDSLRHYAKMLGFTSLVARLTPPAETQPIAKPKPAPPPQSPFMFEGSLFGAGPAAGAATTPTSDGCRRLRNMPPGYPANTRSFTPTSSLPNFWPSIKRQKRFAFDTETDALGAMNSNLVGMSFSWQPEVGYYVPVCGPPGSKVWRATRRWRR
jgi:DNA polymerase-1